MKILLTGASGYLGRYINNALKIEHEIFTIGRKQASIICDLQNDIPALPVVDIVIHAAGKAHIVPKTAIQKQEMFDVNVRGTKNLLQGLEKNNKLPASFVFISSVSVYGLSSGEMISETHPLEAKDSYGLSKIEAEKEIEAWCKKYDILCTILRLPLIAGNNPPGNLQSIINGISKKYYFNVNYGVARKSMVLAVDVGNIILKAASIGGIYNLTDGYHPSFFELCKLIARDLNKPMPKSIPLSIATVLGFIGDRLKVNTFNSDRVKKMTLDLTFDDSKARRVLNWGPTCVLEGFSIK
jgi:nucleoside-diphosphate-sugar epimerase